MPDNDARRRFGASSACHDSGMCQRLLAGLLVVALVGLAGCGEENTTPSGPHYVTTVPPFAAIVAPVVGERGRVTTLLAAGDSPHTYEPRPSDVQRAEAGTAVLYGAPHLDVWAADLPAPHHIALIDLVPAKHRLPAPGGVHDHAGDAANHDPHFWTDPLVVRALLPALTDTLCALDQNGCATYTANAASFADSLTALDAQLQALLGPVQAVPVLLAQPFFQYFMHRYGPQLAGVVEPQPSKEPSPRALQGLITEARRVGAQAVLIQRQLPPRAAEAVAEGAGLPLVTLDPLGGTAGRRSYHDLLRHNAEALRDALIEPSTAP